MQNTICVGLSLPKEILKKIDEERQDIPRSKYVVRIIERLYFRNGNENKNCHDSLDSSPSNQYQANLLEMSK